ncbi:N-acetyltransferase [Rhodobacteraceae bacterium W635]|uniref:GNAT family N-acetyltransferase n=1 Tax=Nioella halotolerans TaxID=2303578 RepID=UPI000E3CEF83|nr:N-acetyltransferase [Rhodobacteraceae bacterium W635]
MAEKRFGAPVTGWTPPPRPDMAALSGRYARLVRLDADAHAADLHRANSADPAIWDYLPYGPFSSAAAYHRWIRQITRGDDPLFFAIQNAETGHFGGVAAYQRIASEMGTIEVGHINLSPELQRSRAATDAMVMMMERAFQAGYRRYEWKCDALNLPSRRAAQRLGFSHEGVFRQAAVVKGRNRDTAWFAVIDKDWPALREAYRAWLDPSNFDARGRQRERLGDLTGLVRVASDPALG